MSENKIITKALESHINYLNSLIGKLNELNDTEYEGWGKQIIESLDIHIGFLTGLCK